MLAVFDSPGSKVVPRDRLHAADPTRQGLRTVATEWRVVTSRMAARLPDRTAGKRASFMP